MEGEFLQLMDRYQGVVHKICRLYRNSPEDRQDLFQEVVYQLWKSYPQFKHASKESTWVYRIALNTALATFRKSKPLVSFTAEVPEPAFQEPSGRSEQEERLFLALGNLNDVDKALISLYLDDFSYHEIAAVMGISESNVGVRLNRIKSKLKQTLNA
ncbi:RNA polymerase sigma factor [Pontibacter beigongshangensis]|uniref:RNA polymerase sigma factor n=1 Tax=Pontibacter beigongshangensis TaxID=2574733 RepID=UPI001650ABC8|nr:sigma-70 family RNA polymerase sigma factor [Pontibacter beigongshangensis]